MQKFSDMEIRAKEKPRNITGKGFGLAGAALETYGEDPENVWASLKRAVPSEAPKFERVHRPAENFSLMIEEKTVCKGTSIIIRQGKIEETKRLVEIYKPFKVTQEQIEKRFENFKEGILCAYKEGDENKTLGSISFILANADIDRSSIWLTADESSENWLLRTWDKLTGDGTFSTNDRYGTKLFCPNIATAPEASKLGLAKPLINTAATWGAKWSKVTGMPIVTYAYSRPSNFNEFVEANAYVYCDEYVMITVPPDTPPSYAEYAESRGKSVFMEEYEAVVKEMMKPAGSKAYYEYIKEHGPVPLAVYMKVTNRKHVDGNMGMHLTNWNWYGDVIPEIVKIIPEGCAGETARKYIVLIVYRPRDWTTYYEPVLYYEPAAKTEEDDIRP